MTNTSDELDDIVLGFVKPDAAERIGEILARFETHHFRIMWLHTERRLEDVVARTLYAEHAQRPFFEPLIEFTQSGPVTIFVLRDRFRDKYPDRKTSAQARFRGLLGAPDATKAARDTLRAEFGTGPGPRNAIHATEAAELIKREAMILGVWDHVNAVAQGWYVQR